MPMPGPDSFDDEELRLFAVALDAIPTGLALAQLDGSLRYINAALLQSSGYTREDLLGHKVRELFPNCAIPRMDELEAHGPWRGEWRAPRKDGKLAALEVTAAVLHKADGSPWALLAALNDVTARYEAESDLRLKDAAIANSINAISMSDLEGKLIYVNDAFCTLLGVPREQILGRSSVEFWPEQAGRILEGVGRDGFYRAEDEAFTPDGRWVAAKIASSLVRDAEGQPVAIATVFDDITARRRVEADLRLKDAAIANSVNAIVISNLTGELLYFNDAFCKLSGLPREKISSRTTLELWPEHAGRLVEAIQRDGFFEAEVSAVNFEGKRATVQVGASLVRDAAGQPVAIITIFVDITARREAEEALRFANLLLATQQEATIDGILIVDGKGKVLSHNRRFAEIWGLTPELLASGSDGLLLQAVMDKLASPEEFLAKVNYLYEHPLESSREEVSFRDGRVLDRYSAPMLASDGTCYGRVWYFRDDTARRQAEHALAQRTRELERSNRELEQFAYVASHDLQEPLRMVSSYTQLLAKRYAGKLDQDANEFIEFAVSGANRMQRLIGDLLSYSRVGTRGKPAGPIDSHLALGQALSNLGLAIAESGAMVTNDDLPTVRADDVQLVQLFQNLIGNAVKFRGAEPPRVHVSARRTAEGWTFAVKDNGPGIAPEYHARIFQIFQRLHSKQYPGTGIGLALCKRIVERHGGEIWVESVPDQGSTFYFTLPH